MILSIDHTIFTVERTLGLLCIIIFLIIGFVFLGVILFSRIFKTYRVKKNTALSEQLQRKLNVFVLYETDNSRIKIFPWRYHLQELRRKVRSTNQKQLLVNLLITNKQNLSGNAAITLKKVYIRLGLKRFSQNKLQQHSTLSKIRGLHELAEMGCVDALPFIQTLFTHRNKKVREESFIAMVRLAGASAFTLLPNYKESISDWTQIVIYKHLSQLPAQRLPKFHQWFSGTSPAVKKFALNMIKEFKQLKAIRTLASLLTDDDLEIAAKAAETLGDLGAAEHAEAIAQLGRRNMLHEALSISVVQALAKIGDGAKHQSFLSWHMIHGSHSLRMEAMKALMQLKVDLLNACIDFNLDNDKEFGSMYAHVADPLLQ